MNGSGISWAMCKSTPRLRQITMPASHHSVFTGRMPFLPPNQQRQSTEGIQSSSCYQWYILIGTQWYQLPEFIPSNSNSRPQLHQHFCLHSTCHLNNETFPLAPVALKPISTLVCPVLVTRCTQPLQTNVFITLYMLPFIALHFLYPLLTTSSLLNYYQCLYHLHHMAILQPSALPSAIPQ